MQSNIQIGYHPNITGKPDKVGKWRNEFVNSNSDLSINDIIELVATHGAATSYVMLDDTLERGRSHDNNIKGAYVVMLDFDNTSSMEEIQQHPWYKHSAFAYTTPSFGKIQEPIDEHKLPPEQYEVVKTKIGQPKDNFRLVFVFEEFVESELLPNVIQGLLSLFPMADQSCSDLARMIYGCKNASVIRNNATVSVEQIAYLYEIGSSFKTVQKTVQKVISNTILSDIAGDINITLADGSVHSISELFANYPRGFKSPCFSPFRHEDNPSAFVTIFENTGNVFVHDSGSNNQKTWFAKDFVKTGLSIVKKKKTSAEPHESIVLPVRYEDTGISSIHKLNERYIPEDLYYDLNDTGLIFVKSPKGTGKTEMLKTLVERVKGEKGSCLLIGHRVALLNNLSKRIGVDSYKEEDPTKFFAISIDSLMKLIEENIGITYDTIIIDEVEQVLNHFKSDTLKKKRKLVFKQFIDKIRAAKRIILLDADVSPEITIDLIRLIRGSEQWASDNTQGFINEYQPGTGRSINMFQTREQMVYAMCELLASTPTANAFVITNSKTFTKELEQLISGLNLPPVPSTTNILGEVIEYADTELGNILTVHSGNATEAKQQQFITNPKANCSKYRAVISSPTISTGVSIDGTHFTHVFGFFNDQPFTYFDCDQAISRVRNRSAVINVWMPEKDADTDQILDDTLREYGAENNIPTTVINNILNNFESRYSERVIDMQIHNTAELYKEIEQTTRRLTMATDSLSEDEHLWVRFLATLDIITADRMRNRKLKYIQYVMANGFNAIDVELDESDHAVGKGFIKANKILAKEEEIQNIWNAKAIEYDEYEALKRRAHIASVNSYTEFLQMRRFEIAEWLNEIGVDLNIDNIRHYIKEDIWNRHIHLKYALMDEADIKKFDAKERVMGKKAIGDMNNRLQIKELLNGLIDAMGLGSSLNDFFQQVVLDKQKIMITSEQLALLCSAIMTNQKDLKQINKLFETKLGQKGLTNYQPKSVWDALFGYVGLELGKRVKVQKNGVVDFIFPINVKKFQWVFDKIAKDSGKSTKVMVNDKSKKLADIIKNLGARML